MKAAEPYNLVQLQAKRYGTERAIPDVSATSVSYFSLLKVVGAITL